MQMSLSLEQNRQTRVTMVWPFTTFVFFLQSSETTNHKNGKATAGLTDEDVAEMALSIFIAGRMMAKALAASRCVHWS